MLRVAETTGRAPSEMLGVTCSYCAYCLDEALVVRSMAQQDRLNREREAEMEIEKRRAEMRGR